MSWWRRSKIPLWLIIIFVCFAIYTVITKIQTSHENFKSFKTELIEAKKPIMYFGTKSVTEEPTKKYKKLMLQDDILECILNTSESSKRPPSNDHALFLHFELNGRHVKLEVRQYNTVFWYRPWVKNEYGYKSYGVSASGKCNKQLELKNITSH